ncbi:MAG: hypothetical protein AB1503_05330 [Bacillota bacterium]
METAGVERAVQACRRRKEELDARLAELESRRRDLICHLEKLLPREEGVRTGAGSGAPAAPPNVGCHLSRPRADNRDSRAESADPAGGGFPASRVEELDCCLGLLKLRCQAMAEELAEVMLLAEALHALARTRALPAGPSAPGPVADTGESPPSAAAETGSAPPAPRATPASAASSPAPGAEALAGIISSPQFQKVAAQLLAQLIKK